MSTQIASPVLHGAPRLGFLGLGWIGRNRMQAVASSGAARIAALSDVSRERMAECATGAENAVICPSLDELLGQDLDGIVIATPSALHADQAIRALRSGVAVFCQKPLARNAAETRAVIDVAMAADLLLGVDLSYRHTAAMRAMRETVVSGAIGRVHSVDLVFHNAYGPDRGWARDPALAGGGCVIDLGIHLIDLAWWVLGSPVASTISSQLFAHGRRLAADPDECEDFATATIELHDGTTVRLACSWESDIGRDAIIEVAFRGTDGAAVMRNVNGSFFDFTAQLMHGAAVSTLAEPPDDWGGRALISWSRQLAAGSGFDPEVEALVDVARTLDAVLGR